LQIYLLTAPVFLPSCNLTGLLTNARRPWIFRWVLELACADPSMDHGRALRSSVAPLPRDWNLRSGRPRQTWLRTVLMSLRSTLWSGNCLSLSTESTGMAVAGGYYHRLIKYSLDFLRPIRTAEAFEAVDWLHQQTWPHCGKVFVKVRT